MSTQTDTKTPRTDAEELFHHDLVDSNFARTLEIELTTTHAALRKAQEALEEVDTLPVARGYPDGPCLDHGMKVSVKSTLTLIQQTLPRETR